MKINHEKNRKHFNNSKFVYTGAKRHKTWKLSLREKKSQKERTSKYDYVLISASTVLNMKIWLVEGLETAAIWFLPSCALKYLAPTGQSPQFTHFTSIFPL